MTLTKYVDVFVNHIANNAEYNAITLAVRASNGYYYRTIYPRAGERFKMSASDNCIEKDMFDCFGEYEVTKTIDHFNSEEDRYWITIYINKNTKELSLWERIRSKLSTLLNSPLNLLR